jgi:hypothetical protein
MYFRPDKGVTFITAGQRPVVTNPPVISALKEQDFIDIISVAQ